jgi:hypothetical protein
LITVKVQSEPAAGVWVVIRHDDLRHRPFREREFGPFDLLEHAVKAAAYICDKGVLPVELTPPHSGGYDVPDAQVTLVVTESNGIWTAGVIGGRGHRDGPEMQYSVGVFSGAEDALNWAVRLYGANGSTH